MSTNKQEIGDPLKRFAARRGKLGSKANSDTDEQKGREVEGQRDSEVETKPDSNTEEKKEDATAIQTGSREAGQLHGDADIQTGSHTVTQKGIEEDMQISSQEAVQKGREEVVQPDSDTGIQTGKPTIVRKKTGYSLDVKLTRRAKYLALDEGKDVNELIEEGLRLVFEKRGISVD